MVNNPDKPGLTTRQRVMVLLVVGAMAGIFTLMVTDAIRNVNPMQCTKMGMYGGEYTCIEEEPPGLNP